MLKLVNHNAQGIRGKAQELDLFLDSEENPDIICWSEVWLNRIEMDLYHLENNMCEASSFLRKERQRGGVSIFKRTDWSHVNIELGGIPVESIFECVAVRFGTQNVIVASCYRVPNSDFQIFLDKFEHLIEKLHRIANEHTKIFIAGDFNVDFQKDTDTIQKRQVINVCSPYGILPLFEDPSRVSQTTKKCIDQIFTNVIANEQWTLKTTETGYSDHMAQILEISKSANEEEERRKGEKKRIYSKNNVNNFKECISHLNWNDITCMNTVDEKMESLLNRLVFNFDQKFPYRVCKTVAKRKQWITKGILISRKKKIWLNEIRKDDPTGIINNYFKKYNRIYKKTIRIAKRKGYEERINRAKNKSKMAWQIIKEETNQANAKVRKPIVLVDCNREKISDPMRVAENFNENFVKAPEALVHSEGFDDREPSYRPAFSEELVLYPCDLEELTRIVKNRKNTFSSGVDGLPDEIMKEIFPSIAHVVLDIVNHSLQQGVFPDCLKIAKVIPLHKKGSKTDPMNYRPLSNLSFFSKIIETVMRNRLVGFLEAFGLLSRAHHGFVNNRSTTTAVSNYIWQISKTLDEGIPVAGLFIDQKRGFDVIDRTVLINKLHQYGVRGTALKWFKSYLTNRGQMVQVDSEITTGGIKEIKCNRSNIRNTEIGLQQGTVLSPILFLIYIDSLAKKFGPEKAAIFADDANFIISKTEMENLQENSDSVCEQINGWFKENKLILNKEKTAAIIFNLGNAAHRPTHIDIKLDGSQIAIEEHTKFLGIHVDRRLNWNLQINDLTKRLNSALYMMRQLKGKVSTPTMLTLYYGKFQSLMKYGCVVWGQGTGWNQVFIAQKKAIRIINGKEWDEAGHPISCKPIFQKLGIMTFPSLYAYECIAFVVSNELDLINDFQPFSSTHNYNTRHNARIRLPLHRTVALEKCVQYQGCKLLNKLPSELLEGSSTPLKLNKIKKYLTGLALYSLNEL